MQNYKTNPLLIILGATALIALILLILPANIQPLVFWFIVLFGIINISIRIGQAGLQNTKQFVDAIGKSRPYIAHISFGVAVVLICVASYFYQPAFVEIYIGFYIYLFGLLLLYPANPVLPPMQASASTETISDSTIRYIPIVIAIVALILLTMINIPQDYLTPVHHLLGMNASPPWVQMALLIGAIVGLAHGFGGRLFPRRFKWEVHHTLLYLIVVFGFALRLWDIENTYRLFVDEYSFLSDVLHMRDRTPPILLPIGSPNAGVYPFFQALFSAILEPGFTSLRLPSIIISTAGIVAIYAFARQLFSIRVALMSALLLATMPVYLQFSRIGLNNIADPVFGVVGFVYILRGMRSGRVSDYAMAGIAFALTHYFYEGGRLFFTGFLICWLVWIHIFSRKDPLFRPITRQQLFALGFCLVALIAPMYHTFYQFRFILFERFAITRTTRFPLAVRLEEFFMDFELANIAIPLHRYVFTPVDDLFYQNEYAFILPILVPFFLLGFGRLLWKIRTVRGGLLIWWMIGASVGNNFVEQAHSAESPRYIIVYAILMVVVALGIQTLWGFIDQRITIRLQRYLKTIVVLFLLSVSLIQIQHYFGAVVPNYYDWIHNRSYQGQARPSLDDVLLRAVELPDNTTLIYISDLIMPTVHRQAIPAYFERSADELQIIQKFVDEIDNDYLAWLPPTTNYVFALMPDDQDPILDMITDNFVVTEITGSPAPVPESAEMLFIHAPISANGRR